MVIDVLLLIVGFSALIIGTISDIKTREVPDWLNFSLIPAGLGLRLIHSVVFSDWMFFVYGILGLVLFVGIAFILYYARQWGGGDSKLLMGIGVLFATYLGFLLNYFSPVLNWHFLFIFLFNLLLIGALYALVWSAFLAVKHWKGFVKTYKKYFITFRIFRRIILLFVALLFIAGLLIGRSDIAVVFLAFAIMIFVSFHLMIFAKVVESCCMYKKTPVAKLTEGDWVTKTVKIRGKYICGPKDYGLTKEQIIFLKKCKVKEVIVKEGVPFVPTFLIAMIVSLIWGNFLYLFF
jgi:Flp pilus assembly protein protease CpaA